MSLNRQVLRKIDDRLRSDSDQEKGEWMAKVPISGATKAVWQRYCQAVGVHMGQGVAILIHHELASVVDEDLETLDDRLNAKQAELDNLRTRRNREGAGTATPPRGGPGIRTGRTGTGHRGTRTQCGCC